MQSRYLTETDSFPLILPDFRYLFLDEIVVASFSFFGVSI